LCATSSDRGRGGFTLLELLIALVLLAVLTTALYASFFTIVKARDRAAEGMEERRELGTTLDLLRREISAALFSGSDKRLHFVVEDRDNFGKPTSILELTTLALPQTPQVIRESGIRTVRYEMVEKEGRTILTRREQDLFFDLQDVRPYPQMEQISGFLVECYDGTKWLRSWNSSLNGGLPSMVRVTVQFEEEGKTEEFSVLATPKVPAW
jgi:general secretion pathway protein J